MRLTVLGNPDRYLAPLSGGSGYLVEDEGTAVLLDCGGGVRDALRHLGVVSVDAAVLSHFHHDHVLDLPTIENVFAPGAPLVIPPGERGRFDALAQLYAFRGPFEHAGGIVEAREPLRVGPLRLTFAPTQHRAPSVAVRVEGPSGASVVYAGDTAPCDALRELARGCDLLVMHTLLARVDPESDHARVHSTAETAGRLAREAGAKRLLLSHRYHESSDLEMEEAASAFHDHVRLAWHGAVLRLR